MIYDALIIGAGPAGATAALMLAKAGWSVAVIEKEQFPRRKVCGEFMSATSLPLLDELGVAGPFCERAGPDVRRVGLFAQQTVLSATMPQTTGLRGPWGRALGREHLDTLLLDAAVRTGATLWQPCCATELRRSPDGYVCTIASRVGSAQLAARLVIAATGSWTRNDWARRAQGGEAPAHRPSDLLAFKAHLEGSDLPADLMPLLVFAGGYGGMVHSDAGRVTLSCCIRRDTLAQSRRRYPTPHAGDAVLQHILASCAGAREALRHARRAGPWLAAGPIRPGIRRRWRERVFFVGNIAGEAHPIVAEGISMAMQSAWLLCRRLIARQDDVAAGRAAPDVGSDYAAAWDALFAARIRAAAVFAYVFTRPSATTALLPVLKLFPRTLTFGAHLSGKAAQPVDAR